MAQSRKVSRTGKVVRDVDLDLSGRITSGKGQGLTPIVGPSKFDDRGDWSWLVGPVVDIPKRTGAHKQLIWKIQAKNSPGAIELPKSVDIVLRHDCIEIRKSPVIKGFPKRLSRILGSTGKQSHERAESTSSQDGGLPVVPGMQIGKHRP